jgi:2,4-dienoyl-CoA reductase-like NADH-dependent reductase (Old Yellow Enzyme family)
VNRIAMAPMTNKQSGADGTLSQTEIDWLARRASGGFGLIITGGYAVHPDGRTWDGQAGLYADYHSHALAELGAQIAQSTSLGVVQLIHGGARTNTALTGKPGVSSVSGPEWSAASVDQIIDIISAHRTAALRVRDAGLHGVEIHSAHGYLPAQFLSTANIRSDAWGGTLEKRALLLRELVRTIRDATGPDFIIGVRLTPEDDRRGISLDETTKAAQWVVEDGADYVHLSLRDPEMMSATKPGHHPLELVRSALPAHVPVIAAGKIWTPAQAAHLAWRGADIVALGRAAIFNPDWPRHFQNSEWRPTLPPFTPRDFAQVDVSSAFVSYLREGWPELVTA